MSNNESKLVNFILRKVDGKRWVIDAVWSDKKTWFFWSEFRTKKGALAHCETVMPGTPVYM